MTDFNLHGALDSVINTFVDETSRLFGDIDSDHPATKKDLFMLSQQVAYALSEFNKIISEK